jgi:hypothetical protein
MKIISTFGLAVAASFTLMQSAEARGGGHYSGGAHFFSGAAHFSAPARSYAAPRSYGGPSRSYSSAAGRYYPGPRVSSMPNNRSLIGTRYSNGATSLRNPAYVSGQRQFSGNRTAAFNSRNYSRSNAQITSGNRTVANRSQRIDRERVIGRYSANNWHRNWDRGRDHHWHGHRCHFRNGFWFIYDPFLYYPWDYGYYPYGGYYDSSYYDESVYPADDYAQAPNDSRSQSTGDARVNDVQSALAREGYYDGAIDGTLGPATRNALRRYQQDHGLDATGGITSGVIRAVRLR